MKAEMFDKIVEARANENVQERIGQFQSAVIKALIALGAGDIWTDPAKACLAVMQGDNRREGWPEHLWERERKAVRDSLLSTMDMMQKALLAAEKAEPGEYSPAEDAPVAEGGVRSHPHS